MFSRALKWVMVSSMRKWVVVGFVSVVLAGSTYYVHSYKEGLRDEGRQECVQAINEQTVIDLQNLLVAEQVVAAELRATATAAAQENAAAKERLQAANASLKTLALKMKEQKENDKEYAAWSDVPLPTGVAERLRQLHSGSNSHPGHEDGN